MSLISYSNLVDLIKDGVITNSDFANVNSSSIDITLGSKIMVEMHLPPCDSIKRLNKKDALNMATVDLSGGREYVIPPGGFILAQSHEIFNLPNNVSAEYKLKSSMARLGLDHLNAGWCDAGWNGSVLTLELKNCTTTHYIAIKEGDKIGQMVFFEHEPVPDEASYAVRGSYNNDKEVTGVKVVSNVTEVVNAVDSQSYELTIFDNIALDRREYWNINLTRIEDVSTAEQVTSTIALGCKVTKPFGFYPQPKFR